MKPKQSEEEIVGNLVTKLSWAMATRNEKRVARAIYKGQEVSGIYGLCVCIS